MDRVIYSTYNSMRRPEYRLVTEIHEDSGKKYVVKRAGDSRALDHLYRIADNRELATKWNKTVSPVDMKQEGDKLFFPFVSGTSLVVRIDTDRFDKEKFILQINHLLDLVFPPDADSYVSFSATDEFVSWFGEDYPEDVQAVCPANIDPIFSNIIETDEGLVCIDYEWVFDFPVPVDFIKYRIVRYFYNERINSFFDGISRDEVMEWFGFDAAKQDLFWKMESHFQQIVFGKDWKYIYLGRYKKNETTIQSLENEITRQKDVLTSKDEAIGGLTQTNFEKNKEIEELEQTVSQSEEKIEELTKAVFAKEKYIDELTKTISAKDEEIENQKKEISLQNEYIQKLENSFFEISNSFSWKMTKPMRGVLDYIKGRHAKT